MANDVAALTKQLARQRKLAEGSLKMHRNAAVTVTARAKAQEELQAAADRIRVLEAKLVLARRLKDVRRERTKEETVVDETKCPRKVERVAPDSIEEQLLERISDADTLHGQIALTNQLVGKLQTGGLALDLEVSGECIQQMLESEHAQVRACGVRLLRFSVDYSDDIDLGPFEEGLVRCVKDLNGVDFGEMVAFVRDCCEAARVDALPESILLQIRKSFHHVVAPGSTYSPLLVMEAIEVSCEICLAAPSVGFLLRFLSIVTHTLVEPPYSGNTVSRDVKTMQLPLVLKFLEDPSLQGYLVECGFVEALISQVVDANLNASSQHNHLLMSRRLTHASDVLCRVQRSPQGLDLLCSEDYKFFRMIVGGLYSESSLVRNAVLGVVASGLRVRKLSVGWGGETADEVLAWERPLMDSRGANERARGIYNGRSCPEVEDPIVIAQMQKVLRACLACKVPQILMEVHAQTRENKLGKRVVLLLSEMVYLKGAILEGPDIVPMGQSLNSLVEREIQRRGRRGKTAGSSVVDFGGVGAIGGASAIKNEIPELDITPATLATLGLELPGDPLTWRRDNCAIVRHLRSGDVDYKALLASSHVLSTKDPGEWNWGAIAVLVRGPLWGGKPLDETLRTTKFFKRVLSYFHPGRVRGRARYAQVGEWTLEALLGSEEGMDAVRASGMVGALAGLCGGPEANGSPSGSANVGGTNAGSPNAQSLMQGSPLGTLASPAGEVPLRLLSILTGTDRGLTLLEESGTLTTLFALTHVPTQLAITPRLQITGGQIRLLLSKWARLGSADVSAAVLQVASLKLREKDDYTAPAWGAAVLCEGLEDVVGGTRALCDGALAGYVREGGTSALRTVLALAPNVPLLGSRSRLGYEILKHQMGLQWCRERWPEWVEGLESAAAAAMLVAAPAGSTGAGDTTGTARLAGLASTSESTETAGAESEYALLHDALPPSPAIVDALRGR